MHSPGEIIVQRFEGSQLADVESMRTAARIVADACARGMNVCVVVGAMPARTADLVALAQSIGPDLSPRELSALLAAGSALSAPLFAMCLHGTGIRARSVASADVPVSANGRMHCAAVRALLGERVVPVVSQALGVSADARGLEGAADLTAIALGSALDARHVELFGDDAGSLRLDYDALLGSEQGPAPVAVALAKQMRVALRLVAFADPERQTLVKHATIAPAAPLRSPSSFPEVAPKVPGQDTAVFEARESNVRGYCRTFPTVFAKAKGAVQWDERGRRYVDFFSGAGALNYGHNPESVKQRMVAYLESDGVAHALDMYTPAKRTFLETLRDVVLAPRGLDYKVQFCGPTGANSVEAALKLARLKKGRTNVASFTGGWHGMTAACLSVCGNRENRGAAGAPLPFTTVLPFPDGPYRVNDALGYVEWLFADPNSGLDKPAALILETVQGEGGIYVASEAWLRGIRALCDKHDVLMIVDDIQVGCGRTGTFFSFERAGIVPDMVCLSKSIGGYGQPMSLLLMRPEVDVWKPGQHTGTFRGNQLGFVAAAAALDMWRDPAFVAGIGARSERIQRFMRERVAPLSAAIAVRGLGMMWGIDLAEAGGADVAKAVGVRAFERGLIIERCGRDDTVLKLMAPLNIAEDELEEGLGILGGALEDVLGERSPTRADRLGA